MSPAKFVIAQDIAGMPCIGFHTDGWDAYYTFFKAVMEQRGVSCRVPVMGGIGAYCVAGSEPQPV
jgi:hypothetical protein